jgi:hypothetical protein
VIRSAQRAQTFVRRVTDERFEAEPTVSVSVYRFANHFASSSGRRRCWASSSAGDYALWMPLANQKVIDLVQRESEDQEIRRSGGHSGARGQAIPVVYLSAPDFAKRSYRDPNQDVTHYGPPDAMVRPAGIDARSAVPFA